ncbi:histone deacetylase family protein [Thalassomonas viridans]|uniref:Histone deacetylase family protein n=1 Tax=Thalassomonas viridans TaxID=137584 RepID=A0AAE9Z3N3_9GAMM|nr:histone deacetylase family protein [Thalassomonas viridans]WDE04592.1 histone deacetylase family protein [Thalassomonas viridans]
MPKTLFLGHKNCRRHDMGQGHPESPQRLQAIEQLVRATDWQGKLSFVDAPKVDLACLGGIHPKHHVQALMELVPEQGFADIDADTRLNPYSLDAALYAVGAALHATDQVIAGQAGNAFCSVRPPGHHAESAIAMGFCLFNSVALAAERALASGMSRVAILDFDVHHGNGTVEIFQDRPEVLVCSSFQYPFYPGRFDDVVRPNICLTPLTAGSDGAVFRQAVERQWTRALRRHQPEMIFISAGFDAHRDDPLGGLNLQDEDFLAVSWFIKDLAGETAQGRIVSLLEGGYQLDALARSVVQHLKALVE